MLDVETPQILLRALIICLYSDIFIDFLINVNCCIVNGRNSIQDDFTFVSPRGSSMVDYCLVPYEHLRCISNFSVIRASS